MFLASCITNTEEEKPSKRKSSTYQWFYTDQQMNQHQIRQTEHPKHYWKDWSGQVIFLSFGTSSVFWGGTDS